MLSVFSLYSVFIVNFALASHCHVSALCAVLCNILLLYVAPGLKNNILSQGIQVILRNDNKDHLTTTV